MHRLEREGRVSQVMRSLFDVIKSEQGTLEMDVRAHRPVDLVAAAIDVVAPRARPKEVVLDGLVGEVGEVLCDRGRLVTVLGDLLANAIDASPRRGAVEVSAEAREDDVVISVSDAGAGIEPADWPYIFDGAWQAPEGRRNGLGLGLAHAKALIEAQGGTISAHSRKGEGTTFSFTLPRAKRTSRPPPPSAPKS